MRRLLAGGAHFVKETVRSNGLHATCPGNRDSNKMNQKTKRAACAAIVGCKHLRTSSLEKARLFVCWLRG